MVDTEVPCPDADVDGVCDGVDACPGGDDAVDTDTDGQPDACTIVELARKEFSYGGFGRTTGVYPYAVALLQPSLACQSTTGWQGFLGSTALFADGVPGAVTFDADDADFAPFAACVTDGVDDTWDGWGGFATNATDAVAAAGSSFAESAAGWDLAGSTLHHVDLVVDTVSVAPDGSGGTTGAIQGRWILYGWLNP